MLLMQRRRGHVHATTARVVLFVLALISVHTAANADDDSSSGSSNGNKQRCFSSYEHAQIDRHDGHLGSSRDKLLICSQEQCPAAIRKECIGWLREVEAALPSVVIRALSAEGGADLTNVNVTCDGKRLTNELDGRAVTMDPGPHTCRFEGVGVMAREERIVVREGEQRRPWAITLTHERTSGPGAGGPSSRSSSNPEKSPQAPIPILVYVLGGLALVGFAATTYFDLSTVSQEHDLDRCKPACASSEVDDARRTQLFGQLSLAGGLAALVGAGIMFFTRPTTATP